LKLLTLFITLTFSLQAISCPEVKEIKKGYVTECDGVFFNTEKEARIREDHSILVQTNDNLNQQLTLRELQLEVKDEEIAIWEREAKSQAKARERMEGDFRKGVLIGVGGTILTFILTSIVIKQSQK
jgi:hypothetical protein